MIGIIKLKFMISGKKNPSDIRKYAYVFYVDKIGRHFSKEAPADKTR